MANGYLPALSVVTGVVELGFAVWLFRTQGRRDIRLPLVGLLLVLAGYQFIEVFACADPTNTFLARLGFVDVVWLPPLYLISNWRPLQPAIIAHLM